MKHQLFGIALVALVLIPVQMIGAQTQADGDGSIAVTGELKQWHKVTLDIQGPFAREADTDPNPFTDYHLAVTFTHESGSPSYRVPGYFAADGNAGQTSATQGNIWRTHLSPDKPGKWNYVIRFVHAPGVALQTDHELANAQVLTRVLSAKDKPIDGATGSFTIAETDKIGRDLRGKGRLEYVGKRYLKFAGTGDYFLKAGADAPETLLAFKDFDGTVAHKKGVPLKLYTKHRQDWQQGDPTWHDGKGKGLIGAINYLSGTGCNAFSFLPYNAGGDGDNVWPFIERDKKFHYDCSKLDQWQIVFDHATAKGMYLHFKLQETENDDLRGKKNKDVPTALDEGKLGPERKLYLRELIARFGYQLALNWNLGEENTQTSEEQRDMAGYIQAVDPYDHLIVIHSYPNQQDKVYRPLLGDESALTGASLQNSNVKDTHWQVVKWINESAKAGKPWVVASDEAGDASFGTPPDPDYPGMDKIENKSPSIHQVRKQVLWGTLLAGGGGVEYYFGYKAPENDLKCEDWRSRDKTWAYSAIALAFFDDHAIPFWEMKNRNDLIGADPKKNEGYCLAKPGEIYLIYLPEPSDKVKLDLGKAKGSYSLQWFNPRQGGELVDGALFAVGGTLTLPFPPTKEKGDDWLAVIRKR